MFALLFSEGVAGNASAGRVLAFGGRSCQRAEYISISLRQTHKSRFAHSRLFASHASAVPPCVRLLFAAVRRAKERWDTAAIGLW